MSKSGRRLPPSAIFVHGADEVGTLSVLFRSCTAPIDLARMSLAAAAVAATFNWSVMDPRPATRCLTDHRPRPAEAFTENDLPAHGSEIVELTCDEGNGGETKCPAW